MPNAQQKLREQSAIELKRLCHWFVSAKNQQVPDDIRSRAALVLFDDIGAMVAASSEPQIMSMHNRLSNETLKKQATIFTKFAPKSDVLNAASANGMAAAWCELDEGYRLAPCHAGAYILPTLLAHAEVNSMQLEQVLHALVLAYEVTTRFARAYPFPIMSVHPHAAFATIGAVCAAALSRDCDADLFMRALTGACSMTFAGPYQHAVDGALVRNAWTAASPWIGMRSMDWAEDGIGGIEQTPYDVFVGCFGTTCKPEELTQDLGKTWAISDGYHKIFACCQYAHSMLEASLELHNRLGSVESHKIQAIEVETHPRGLTLTGANPENVLAAKFSMPHAAAAVACLATGGQSAFSAQALQQSDIARLRENVLLKPYEPLAPWPHDRPARVTWILADGTRHVAECLNARGGADMPFDQETLLQKFKENTQATFPAMINYARQIIKGHSEFDRIGWDQLVEKMVEMPA